MKKIRAKIGEKDDGLPLGEERLKQPYHRRNFPGDRPGSPPPVQAMFCRDLGNNRIPSPEKGKKQRKRGEGYQIDHT